MLFDSLSEKNGVVKSPLNGGSSELTELSSDIDPGTEEDIPIDDGGEGG
jgi:hypothetical protein